MAQREGDKDLMLTLLSFSEAMSETGKLTQLNMDSEVRDGGMGVRKRGGERVLEEKEEE